MTQTAAAAAAAAPKRIHIFKPGRHTTMAGEAIEFSQADIEATARAYDPKASRAPLVIGHPKTDDPAQGWVTGLQADETGLYALADQVDPAFAEAVRAGRYGAVSARFYRPTDPNNPKPGVWYPRHVGFLGAMPPAVKGLTAPEFAEGDGVCFEEGVAFTGWEAAQSASLWRSLRDWLIGQFGQDTADRVVPSYKVSDLESEAQRRMATASAPMPAFSEAAAEPAPAAAPAEPPAAAPAAAPNVTPQETTVTPEEAQELRDKLQAREDELAALRAADAKRATDAVRAEHVAFAEQLATDARIPAAQVPLVAWVGAELQLRAADVEFGEGAEQKPLHQAFRDFLATLPKLTGTGEQATRDRVTENVNGSVVVEFAEGEVDPDRAQLDRRIREHAAAHKVSYAVAAREVMRSR